MNADDLEMARRFVACKGWQWIEGMQILDGGAPLRICALDGACALAMGSAPWPMVVSTAGASPDLSDALTRAGLLEVVRRAWGDPCIVSWPAFRPSPGTAGVWMVYCAGRQFQGASEAAALLAALEAAPHA